MKDEEETLVVLAIGSNLDDRLSNLKAAICGMADYMTVIDVSPVYETAPMLVTDQPAFLNAVFCGKTKLSPEALLSVVKRLEHDIGRRPTFRYGPRVIDIDILFCGDQIVKTQDLDIPHIRVQEREFVLRPLSHILPDFKHPVLGLSVTEMLQKLETERPVCLGPLLADAADAPQAKAAQTALVYDCVQDACATLGFSENGGKVFTSGIKAYLNRNRIYHGLDHGRDMALSPGRDIKALSEEAQLNASEAKWIESVLTVAGWCHDFVYIGVDDRLLPDLAESIKNDVTLGVDLQSGVYANVSAEPSRAARIVCDVFGVKPGEEVRPGLNEFLSALSCARLLSAGKELSEPEAKSLAAIAAGIEATIPFRAPQVFDALYERLNGVGLTVRESQIAVQAAAWHSNRDVEAFCGVGSMEEGLRLFISNTWQLAPESGPLLLEPDYTPRTFREMLQRNLDFLSSHLDPARVFHGFKGVPSDAELAEKAAKTRQNVDLAQKYLKAKLASASFVEALFAVRDPDGEKSLRQCMSRLILPVSIPASEPFDEEGLAVLNVLVDRDDRPIRDWDIPGSPLAAYLVGAIGFEGAGKMAEWSQACLNKEQPDYAAFLARMEKAYPAQKAELSDALIRENETLLDFRARQRCRPAPK
ncbi:MAG: 2-amino-4-hydroxy-6-hydroxymethyldihydropteridine diphosphokinase [Alphaproteobacteria bacterium]|nr:2-amino-4-hydroxy-6-hydroxymethyldihydropteridine diphosphokinase [Alphaproteobacteria bacterium]